MAKRKPEDIVVAPRPAAKPRAAEIMQEAAAAASVSALRAVIARLLALIDSR